MLFVTFRYTFKNIYENLKLLEDVDKLPAEEENNYLWYFQESRYEKHNEALNKLLRGSGLKDIKVISPESVDGLNLYDRKFNTLV